MGAKRKKRDIYGRHLKAVVKHVRSLPACEQPMPIKPKKKGGR